MKIIVDKLPENPIECIFSRINTGTRRCAHNGKICPLTRGEECPFLAVAEAPSISAMMNPISEPVVEPKKRTTKRSTAKKAE
jgi:hypothetical protein